MAVVEQLREKRENKQRQNWAAYADLLRSLASGETVHDTELDIVVDMVGKTLTELEPDVAKMKQRLAWSETLNGEQSLRQRLRDAEAEHQTALAELRETTARLTAIVNEKHSAIRAIEMHLDRVPDARSALFRSCMDAELLEREKSNTASMLGLRNELEEAEHALRQRGADLHMVRRDMVTSSSYHLVSGQPATTPPRRELVEREAWLVADIASREQELQPLRARMGQLKQEQAEILSAKLVP